MLSANGTTIAHPDTEKVINANNDIELSKEDSSLASLAAVEQKMLAENCKDCNLSYRADKSTFTASTSTPGFNDDLDTKYDF